MAGVGDYDKEGREVKGRREMENKGEEQGVEWKRDGRKCSKKIT